MDAAYDSTALTLAVTAGFLLFAGGFWAIVSLGQWALAPVERRMIAGRLPTQYSLREFLVLAVQVQLIAGVVLWWWGDEAVLATAILSVAGFGLAAAWWQAMRRLSRSRVTCPLRRGVFLAMVTPLASAAITAALWINGQAVLDMCAGRYWPLAPWLAGNLVIIGAFVACRLLTVWAMRNVTPREAISAADDGIQYVSN